MVDSIDAKEAMARAAKLACESGSEVKLYFGSQVFKVDLVGKDEAMPGVISCLIKGGELYLDLSELTAVVVTE